MLTRKTFSPPIDVILLLVALVLAPIIGGGIGELAAGVLQILILAAISCRLLLCRKSACWTQVPGWWFLVGFAALTLVSVVCSRAIYYSLAQLLFFSACFGGFLLAGTLSRDKKIASAIVWTLVLSALYVSGAAVRGYILDAGGGAGFWKALTSAGAHARLFGPFINPNFFSGYLVVALPVTLALYLTARKNLLAVLPAVAFVFEVVALMLTGAKFGVIAAGAALIVFLLLAGLTRSWGRLRVIRLAILAAIMIVLLIPFSRPVESRVEEAQTGGTQVHSTAFRIYTWKATLHMIQAQPLLGVGPGAYGITYPQYTIAGPTKFAHNSYLQIAAETGAPALLAFVLLLLAIAWSSLRGMWKRADEEPPDEAESGSITWTDFVIGSGWRLVNCALFAGLLGSVIRNLVDSDWYIIGIALPFWIVAGVLVADRTEGREISPGKVWRWVAAVACVAFIVLSATFGMGDFWATRAKEAGSTGDTARAVGLYANAAAISPLNPEYHRQLGLWLGLGDGQFDKAYDEVDKSISLARNTSEGGWKARGMLASAQDDWRRAVADLRTAVRYNPNSTDTLNLLASAYESSADTKRYEATLQRLIEVEKSPYEQIKGTPELVDTTYASAHAYFGRKYMNTKHYALAAAEFKAAVDRLELWRNSGEMRKLQKMMGMSNEAEDQRRLGLLKECYAGLADAYSDMGRKADAARALENMRKVE